ncbi:hypothetical protein ACFYOT_31080 [Saccharothrix saharensis]|uniref:hypothetical protein n=1 Tax=Saccharothrix saharensis TaxID=571190 RepID=UPI0036ACF917
MPGVRSAVIAWTDFPVDSPFHSRFTVDWAQVEDEQPRVLAERLAGRQEKYPDVPVHRVVVVHDRVRPR